MPAKIPGEEQLVTYNGGGRYTVISGDRAFWEKRKSSELKKVFAGLAIAVAGAIPTWHGVSEINELRANIAPEQIAAHPLRQQFKIECIGNTLTRNAATLGKNGTPVAETLRAVEKDAGACTDQKTRQAIAERDTAFKSATAISFGGFLALCFGILFMSAKHDNACKAKDVLRKFNGPGGA